MGTPIERAKWNDSTPLPQAVRDALAITEQAAFWVLTRVHH